jgi:glycosyltransferase involved in cell wall biosynthesis
MKILYSFNKRGAEAAFWQQEIAAASNEEITFIPFNHDSYVDTNLYLRAQRLDDLYFERDAGLMRLYDEVEARVRDEGIDVIMVDTCPPYHPDWLLKLPLFKVLRVADGPLAAYDRDFAYTHAYDLVLYHTPAYSRDMDMGKKLKYVGARQTAFWPLGVFDATFSPELSEDQLFSLKRDIDVVFVGALHLGKMPLIAKVKKAFGSKCRLYGLTSLKKNLYFNARYGFPGWVRPIKQSEYVPLYQRAKIGFNVHNRGKYTVGGYRFYELPANGVMQISDGEEYLATFYQEGDEIIDYKDSDSDDLIDKIRFYLANDTERERVARNAYRRVMRDYRVGNLLHQAGAAIKEAMR